VHHLGAIEQAMHPASNSIVSNSKAARRRAAAPPATVVYGIDD